MKVTNLVAAIAVMALGVSASAAPVIDQKFDTQSGHALDCWLQGDDYEIAQTFTVGTSGQLTKVSFLKFWKCLSPTNYPDLLFYVSRTDASGAPIATGRLAEQVFTPDQVTSVGSQRFPISLDVSKLANIYVRQGEQLAIGLRAVLPAGSEATYPLPYAAMGAVAQEGYPGYAGGQVYSRNHPWDGTSWTKRDDRWDIFFETSVDPAVVPEPSSVMAMITGLGGFAWRRRR